jgi:hypothetical protein
MDSERIGFPECKSLQIEKKRVLLTVCVIEGMALWSNGLHQNCLFLYKLFEAANYIPYFLVQKKTNSVEEKQYNVVEITEFDINPFHIHALIIIGANCDKFLREKLIKKGTKIFTLLLGNVLNIDIEKPMFTDIFNKHHSEGFQQTLLSSPHYHLAYEYIDAIYNVNQNSKMAPYVWDSYLIKDLIHMYEWSNTGPFSFTIMEPNIGFQKCSLVPIMICESYYRNNPNNMEGIVVINGSKLIESQYFLTNILSNLELYKSKRIFLIKRLSIREAATTFKQNIIIHHAVNNDYNYLFLEYLFMGFPVIHNYEMLKEYGYYYKGDDIEAGKNMIEYVINNHGSNLATYKASCQQLIWKFSIYNPDNINGWKNILS